ncbi:GNAT family N-acetyltransferase [Sphaerotilus sp.]|uniref:GNAT family N-acetyltransferase n=1 Tax=Sphaerotilus sp. TaxID=2093942 RepID=UPI002ACD5E27|nr:GNAT family N-acyltransferase [Sphaerotilus sp.]MDZ7857656.1 GNAT family N-acyltransferase [Sphaerotilus sp.]
MRELPQPTLPLADLRPLRKPAPAAPRAARAPVERFSISWARHLDEVREAQALRYRVFAEEMGAQLTVPPGSPAGLDIDRFDAYCEHLIVRCEDDSAQAGEVIGTYRVLTPGAAQRLGGWYSDTEFDLTALRSRLGRTAELGRSCVHPAHRQGGVILALWGALGAFLQSNQLDIVIGCASVSMHDGGHVAASLWERLRITHLASPEYQVRPRLALPVEDLRRDLPAELPPLIKGYLRCGAKVLGAPAWDPDFNTADLPMMMRLQDLPERYRRHFLAD